MLAFAVGALQFKVTLCEEEAMVREVGAEVVAQGKVVVAERVPLVEVPAALVAVRKYEYEVFGVSPVSA